MKSDEGREYYAIKWALISLIVLLLLLGLSYGLVYKKEGNRKRESEELFATDIVTIVGSCLIFVFALVYWKVFYHGYFICSFKSYSIRNHATEAYFMYTMMYTFGIGILMPFVKWVISKENYAEGLYPFYPVMFISMLIGYYIYEFIKLGHHYLG
jgi:magnesium-transporting ATPase (P-type)